jgi:hypothetical protein
LVKLFGTPQHNIRVSRPIGWRGDASRLDHWALVSSKDNCETGSWRNSISTKTGDKT